MPKIDEKNIFLNNLAYSYGNDFASYPIRLRFQAYYINGNETKNSTENLMKNKFLKDSFEGKNVINIYNSTLNETSSFFKLENISSGVKLDIILHFEAIDHFNQTSILIDDR